MSENAAETMTAKATTEAALDVNKNFLFGKNRIQLR